MFVRDMFAGVNSPKGFYSYFPYISDDADCVRKVYIKGGSGMGKSTIMKAVAKRAVSEGYKTERFHCSSDAGSLDGLNLPELGFSILDATAPHICDPPYPGCGSEILNVSEFMDPKKCIDRRNDLARLGILKGQAFAKGYKYMTAAAALLEDDECFADEALYEGSKIAERFFCGSGYKKPAKQRKMFLSALCPGGIVNYHEQTFSGNWVVGIAGEIAHAVMSNIRDAAIKSGLEIEVFYCPMFPDKVIDHIYLPVPKLVFSAQNEYHSCNGDEIIDLTSYNKLDRDFETINELSDKAIKCFVSAKEIHGEIEKINIPAMNFDALNDKTDALIKNIFA